MELDLKLLDFATERQKQVIHAVNDMPTVYAAAEKLGLSERSLYRNIGRVKKKAAKQGYSPEHDQTHTAPETQYVKGVSTCLLYTSPSPRDRTRSRMPSSA